MQSFDIDINFNLNNAEELETASTQIQELGENAEKTQTDVDKLGAESEESSSEVKDLGDSSASSSEDINLLGDAIAGIAALGLAAEFNNTATAADKYNVSMAALNQVASNNQISMDKTTEAIQKVTDATSIGGGQARSYFTMLMNLGVTNTNALADSMINLKGQSAITGGSIEQMSSKLTTIVNGTSLSARSLTNLGLSMKQLASTNGKSVEDMKTAWSTMTADEKLQALNNAMAQNSDLVNTMNQTTGEQLQEVSNSWAALETTVGQSSTVMNQAFLGLINGGIQGLNDAVKNIPFASTFAAGGLAIGSLVTGVKPALDTFNSLSMTVKNGADAVSGAIGGLRTMRDAINTVREAESISAGIKAVLTGATVAETAVEGANAATKSAGIAPTWALALAENALLWPLLLIVGAVVAVIAVLWYLYNTNTTVRNGINTLINALKLIATIVAGVVILAFNKLKGIFDKIKGVITGLASAISGTLTSAWNTLTGAVNSVLSPLRSVYDSLKSVANLIPSIDLGALGGLFGGVSFEGFNGSNTTLNSALLTSTGKAGNHTTTINNNFNGIIEDDAKNYIVNAVNEKLSKENLIRGK